MLNSDKSTKRNVLQTQHCSIPTLCVNKGNVLFFFKSSDIVFCKSEGNYTQIYLSNGDVYTSSKNLKELSGVLTSSFMYRVHHSYIVNVDKIKKMKNDENLVLKMDNDHTVLVSRRKKNDFLNQFLRF